MYELDLNIRPSWGGLSVRKGSYVMHGVKVLEIDEAAGMQWFLFRTR